MTLSPELKAEVLASARRLPSPTLAEARRHRWFWSLAGVLGAGAVFFARGGVRITDRPLSLVLLTALGTALATGAGAGLLLTRGGAMWGRPGRVLLLAALGSAGAFLGWKYGVSAVYGHTDAWPTRPGWRCLGVALSCAAPLLVAAIVVGRRFYPVRPWTTGAALGAGVGLSSAVLVDLWCPVAHLPHLLLGHVLPVAVLSLVGGAVLRARAKRRL